MVYLSEINRELLSPRPRVEEIKGQARTFELGFFFTQDRDKIVTSLHMHSENRTKIKERETEKAQFSTCERHSLSENSFDYAVFLEDA